MVATLKKMIRFCNCASSLNHYNPSAPELMSTNTNKIHEEQPLTMYKNFTISSVSCYLRNKELIKLEFNRSDLEIS